MRTELSFLELEKAWCDKMYVYEIQHTYVLD
jgi:hypothetical protein